MNINCFVIVSPRKCKTTSVNEIKHVSGFLHCRFHAFDAPDVFREVGAKEPCLCERSVLRICVPNVQDIENVRLRVEFHKMLYAISRFVCLFFSCYIRVQQIFWLCTRLHFFFSFSLSFSVSESRHAGGLETGARQIRQKTVSLVPGSGLISRTLARDSAR